MGVSSGSSRAGAPLGAARPCVLCRLAATVETGRASRTLRSDPVSPERVACPAAVGARGAVPGNPPRRDKGAGVTFQSVSSILPLIPDFAAERRLRGLTAAGGIRQRRGEAHTNPQWNRREGCCLASMALRDAREASCGKKVRGKKSCSVAAWRMISLLCGMRFD